MQNLLNRIVKYSIYALVFLLPLFWLPFTFEFFEYNKQYLLFFLVSLSFFAWLLKQVVYDKEIKFKNSPINYLILGFLLISILSAVFSADKNSSIFGFYGRFSDGLIGLLSLAVFYLLLVNNVQSEPAIPSKKKQSFAIGISQLLNAFLASVSAVLIIAYFSVFGIWAKIDGFLSLPQVMLQGTFNSVAGSLEGLSVFLAVIIVLLTGLLLNKRRNIFYWALLSGSLGLLMAVDFTPAWLILLATLVLFIGAALAKRIFSENVNQLLLPVFLAVIALVFAVFQPIKMNLPKEQVLPQPVSWQIAVNSATDNIKNGFLGSGLGTFHYDFAKYKPQGFNQTWMWQIRFDRSGSHLSELMATVGFPGFLAFLGIAALLLLISWFFISKDFIGLPLVMSFTALVAGTFVYYQNTSLAFLFWMILGLSVVSWPSRPLIKQEKRASFKNFPESSLIFTTSAIILGVAILSLYFYGAKYYLADVNYSKAIAKTGEQRISGLEKAVKQGPDFSSYKTMLARFYLIDALNETQKPSGEQDSAKIQLSIARAVDRAILSTQLQSNLVANWEALAVVYRELKDFVSGAREWGIKSFERAIALEPTNPVLYTELGKLYLAMGDKERARNNFDKAIEEKSDYAAAAIQLALLLEQDNLKDEAAAKLENIVQGNLLDADARFQLGRLYFNNNRTDEAIAQLQAAIILAPNHSNAHYSLGVIYASKGEKDISIQEFERVLELNPGNSDVLQKLKELGK